MSLRPVRILGDPILRRRADPIIKITDEVRRLADDMYETMYAAKGIGLAAPQVGAAERLFVTDVDGAKFVMINPEIVRVEGPMEVGEEGCLSIPEIMGDVKRPANVVMQALDLNGETITVEASGMLARCFQHELDHLDGRVFIDRLSFLKRRKALAEWEEHVNDFPGFIRILTPGDPGDPDRGHSEDM